MPGDFANEGRQQYSKNVNRNYDHFTSHFIKPNRDQRSALFSINQWFY